MRIWLVSLLLFFSSPTMELSPLPSDQKSRIVDNDPRGDVKNISANNTSIKGVSFVSPQQYISEDYFSPIKQLNANWVALTPFGFLDKNDTQIQFPTKENYWGDNPKNLRRIIQLAQNQQLKILLKPHVWVNGQGWAGDYDLYFWEWKHWEKSYEQFIFQFVDLAVEMKIEMFCIGVEWKKAVERRPTFWKQLIKKIRKVYSGKLIYAANWDEYDAVPFWDQLDYVGIDGYFPLSKKRTPSLNELKFSWNPIVRKLDKFHQKNNRPIIFTEYGYRSTDYACSNQWEIEHLKNDELVNLKVQQIGYQAFYESVWQQGWCAGGFIWKWYPEANSGGLNNSNYTPQGKPVLKIIEEWYQR